MPAFRFPQGFLWGAATSSHQVEGNNTLNDWWEWEAQGKVPERSGEACRHYELFERDFDLAKSLHHNAHRFSIEWSRVESEPGAFDEREIEHYREMLLALRARGLEPVVTLSHFTIPLWLSLRGGWESAEIPYHFERFTHKIVKNLGGEVRFWITINEPLVQIYHGYVKGIWPPGKINSDKTITVFRHMVLAHQRAYAVIHGVYQDQWRKKPEVGLAQNIPYYVPCSCHSLLDRVSVFVRDFLSVLCFFDGLVNGEMHLPGVLREKLPWKKTLDFIGLNYYTREFVNFTGWGFPKVLGERCTKIHHRDIAYRNEMGWENYPEGFFKVLMRLKRFKLPVMVTENGTCSGEDDRRWDFTRLHLEALARAMRSGVPVIGYLYWSLIDNFEWARGFSPRFGLAEVDYRTQERRVRPSSVKFAEICRKNSIEL